ncbi:uncharacterized protein LOC132284108 [Cornus florida]|uniref:uncharacterized protein LOC132284108 n=1 Tax=Cornus florida TaxID=4283 RepID=UPI00289720DA|nr:uncharacterized protein LOC132284108 [Cornus florida]
MVRESLIVMAETAVVESSPPLRRHKPLETSSPSSFVSAKSHFEKLTHELFVEILQKLPLKLIHLCKCVSKHWYALISTPHFARCYIQNCSFLVPPFALFYQYQNRAVQLTSESPIFESRGFSLNFLPSSKPSSSSSSASSSSNQHEPDPIRYLASSNGLVLCSPTLTFQRVYYVCNPLTMHWVHLPRSPTCHERVVIGFVCKTSYSSDGTTCTTSFRLVRIHPFEKPQFPPPRSGNLKFDIFSSDTWKWREIIISTQGDSFIMTPDLCNAVVCNGILHWMYLYHGKIFAYDPFNNPDQFRTIRQPKDTCSTFEHRLGECQGHLRFIQLYRSTLSIWELKDYSGVEWSLVHNVELDRLKSEDSLWVRNNKVLVLPLHPIDADIVYLHVSHRIILCNMRSKTLKEVCFPDAYWTVWHLMTFAFVLPWWPTTVPQFQRNAIRINGQSIQVSEPTIHIHAQEDILNPQQEAAAPEPTRGQLVDKQVVNEGDVRSNKLQIDKDNTNACPLGSQGVVSTEKCQGQEEGISTQAQCKVSQTTAALISSTAAQNQSVIWRGISMTHELATILVEVTLLHPETFQCLEKKFLFFKQFVFESVGKILLILRQFRHRAVSASEVQFIKSTMDDLKEANIEIAWLEDQLPLAEMKMAKVQLAVRMERIQKDIAEVEEVATRLKGKYATLKESFDAIKDVDVNQLGSG